MNILILGHGVIGSIYGYIFQKNAHHVRHLLRDNPTQKNGQSININMLDGRYNKKGES
ncbi:2-dehydropantoate 2-reductase N-terminal domain-containing protein [Leuconostoc citreum]